MKRGFWIPVVLGLTLGFALVPSAPAPLPLLA
jgi:hypothetical protein